MQPDLQALRTHYPLGGLVKQLCAVCGVDKVHHSKWASQDRRLAVYRGHGVEDFASVRIEELYDGGDPLWDLSREEYR